jgi:anti-sigma factor RsiW
MRWWRTSACERAAQWISLDLDGELSQLERAALGRHLDGCPRCREIGADVRAFTTLLREAPLAELYRPVELPAARRARARTVRRVGASLAFAMVTAFAVAGAVLFPSGGASPHSAFAFRNAQEQQRFANMETQRLEPAVFAVDQPTVQSFAPRVLV